MSDRVFLDTNVLVYAFDADAGPKRERALAILGAARAATHAVSPQVLAEFYNAVTRKLPRRLSEASAREALGLLSRWTVVPADGRHVLAAVALRERYRLSIWDALILQSARDGGCSRVLTEDLQDGMRIGDVVIENPFLSRNP